MTINPSLVSCLGLAASTAAFLGSARREPAPTENELTLFSKECRRPLLSRPRRAEALLLHHRI